MRAWLCSPLWAWGAWGALSLFRALGFWAVPESKKAVEALRWWKQRLGRM